MIAWLETLRNTRFLFELVAIVQVITGFMLVINKFVPLALLMIFPVIMVAFLSHFFMDVTGIVGSIVFLSLIILNIIWNKGSYKEILKA
jgi:putative oxidoreductase